MPEIIPLGWFHIAIGVVALVSGGFTLFRLNSTVVGLSHQNGDLDGDVDVTYVNGNKGRTVTGSKVVWAGYHAMLPLVYTNVLIRNWRSFVELGFWRAYCPGSFFPSIRVNRPMSIGDYRFPQSPDEPVVLHLQHIPTAPGLPAPDQFQAGRRALLET